MNFTCFILLILNIFFMEAAAGGGDYASCRIFGGS
jgi:hypothetical protein